MTPHHSSRQATHAAVLALAVASVLGLLSSAAWAITPPEAKAKAAPVASSNTSAQLAADNKAALARYESDKKLCNEEASSGARLQCRRDAKSEYDQALANAKTRAATVSPAPATPPAPAPASSATTPPASPTPAVAACAECGRILAIAVTEKAGEYSAVGVLAGGAIGALLGNQVGGGTGKDLATLAGAVGGAYAGKVIEEKIKTHKVWSVTVLYTNESKASFDFTTDPGFQVGDRVKNSGNTIVRQ